MNEDAGQYVVGSSYPASWLVSGGGFQGIFLVQLRRNSYAEVNHPKFKSDIICLWDIEYYMSSVAKRMAEVGRYRGRGTPTGRIIWAMGNGYAKVEDG